jgi:hypothetical protein
VRRRKKPTLRLGLDDMETFISCHAEGTDSVALAEARAVGSGDC